MSDSSLQLLADIAVSDAALSARAYLAKNGLSATTDALVECLCSHIKAAIPTAIHDAKEVLNVGMGAAAVATFRASMVAAGIKAAKECGAVAAKGESR